MSTFTYAGEVMHVEPVGTFHTGEVAWAVVTARGERWCRLSVNLGFPPSKTDPTLFWLKGWSENFEVVSAAIAQHVIEIDPTITPRQAGHVLAQAARVRP